MEIHGIQKLTLLDYPGRLACTVFTAGCNFRCPFCHNAGLVTEIRPEEAIDEQFFFEFLKKRVGVLDGVCVSGGEPLLQPDILPFLKKIKALGYGVKLDTNGSFPDKLEEIIQAGAVDSVAMDIKNAPQRYGVTVGIPDYDCTPVERSVELLRRGAVDFEFRTTVVREFHDVHAFETIGCWLSGAEKYFLQTFADSGALIGRGLHACSAQEMNLFLETARRSIPNAQLRES